MNTAALVLDAVEPVVTGTVFREDTVNNAGARTRTSPGRSAYLIWCVGARGFRAQHPDVPQALDPLHPDGCVDLIIEVDEAGRLRRVDIEMLAVADDLAGQPIEDALPEVVDRLAGLLRR